MAQALVCPACRTWFEGKGKAPRCPSCGRRYQFQRTQPFTARYEPRSRPSGDERPTVQAALSEGHETPAFLGRSANGFSAKIGVRQFFFRLATQLSLVVGGIIGIVGLILLNILLVIIGAALIGGALIFDAVFGGQSSDLLGAHWFYRYTGRE